MFLNSNLDNFIHNSNTIMNIFLKNYSLLSTNDFISEFGSVIIILLY